MSGDLPTHGDGGAKIKRAVALSRPPGENLRVFAQDLGYFLKSFANFFLAILAYFTQILFIIGLI